MEQDATQQQPNNEALRQVLEEAARKAAEEAQKQLGTSQETASGGSMRRAPASNNLNQLGKDATDAQNQKKAFRPRR